MKPVLLPSLAPRLRAPAQPRNALLWTFCRGRPFVPGAGGCCVLVPRPWWSSKSRDQTPFLGARRAEACPVLTKDHGFCQKQVKILSRTYTRTAGLKELSESHSKGGAQPKTFFRKTIKDTGKHSTMIKT